MKISTKMIVGFCLLFALFGLAELYGYNSLEKVVDRAGKSDDMQSIVKNILEARRHEKNLIIRGDATYRDKVTTIIAEIKRQALASKENLQQPGHQKLMTDVLAAVGDYEQEFGRLTAALQAGNTEKAVLDEIDKKMVAAARRAQKACETAMEVQKAEMNGTVGEAKRNFALLFITAMLLGVSTAFFIIRSVSRSIAAVVASADGVADGNLAIERMPENDTEAGHLGKAFNGMIDSVSTIVHSATATAAKVSVSTHHIHVIADRINDLSSAVAGQAAQVADASRAMAASSQDIADKCQIASDGAQRAAESAENGTKVVEKTVGMMGQIADTVTQSAQTVTTLMERSNRIGDIIDTIKEIADQTNLLALNASIEAARAGEQGRGFAVVADEVRALAERTAKATHEIAAMIESIQGETRVVVEAMEQGMTQVRAGTAEAALSGDALREILTQVTNVAEQVGQIAAAAESQTTKTGEISNSIEAITSSINTSAVEAKASTQASNQLNAIAEELMGQIGKFRIQEDAALALNKAKSAHMIFNGKIKSHLDGATRLEANALPTHLTCAFGKWYQSAGSSTFQGNQLFASIDQYHAKVHALGKQAVEAHDAGNREKAMALCDEMETNSLDLVNLLDKLIASIPPHSAA